MATTPRTRPTDQDPAAYCAGLPTARRREEGARLLESFTAVTGEPGVMWGPSMIGFGTAAPDHRGNVWFRLGFSPRKAAISLYGLQAADGSSDLLDRLGKHHATAGCVYVSALADVDPEVLRDLIRLNWESEAVTPGC